MINHRFANNLNSVLLKLSPLSVSYLPFITGTTICNQFDHSHETQGRNGQEEGGLNVSRWSACRYKKKMSNKCVCLCKDQVIMNDFMNVDLISTLLYFFTRDKRMNHANKIANALPWFTTLYFCYKNFWEMSV